MKSFRIKPLDRNRVSISVLCDCGSSTLAQKGKHAEFAHTVMMGMEPPEAFSFNLSCTCGRTYRVIVQRDHFHVAESTAKAVLASV
jgi:hypothetical protein